MPRKSERKTKKTTTSKKTKKSTARKSKKKKADEMPKKRKISTKEPKRKTKRAKKTLEAEASELTELQIIEVASELAETGKKKEKGKVSKQVIALKEKLATLKMKMKQVLEKGERKQEQCINLEMEILRLKRLLEQKVENETNKDEAIIGILAQAKSQSKSYKAALKEKEVELKRCLGDIKQLQQNLSACKEEHKKTKTFFEDALKKERAKDSDSSSNLTRKLKETEDAYREGQRKLNQAQSRYTNTQKLLEQSVKRVRSSEQKIKSLGAELKKNSQAKSFLESDLSKLYENVSTFLKKLESESKRMRKVRKPGSREQPVSSRQVGKPLGDSRVDNMIRRLSAALKVVNEDRSFIISKLTTQQRDIKDKPESKIDLNGNKFGILEKQHKQLILEKEGLEQKLNKMSKQLDILEGKKKVMGMTIREGTKGRMKLRKMLDDTRRAKTHAEAALLTKESEYSKQVQELRTQLAALQAKSSSTQ